MSPPATKAIAAAAEISVTAVALRRYDKRGCFIDLEITRVEWIARLPGIIRRRQEYSSDSLQHFGGEFVMKDPRPVRLEPRSQAKRRCETAAAD
jgi:hypothetical protein